MSQTVLPVNEFDALAILINTKLDTLKMQV